MPLARLGKLCDFTVTVLDDRPQFANQQRFPDADEVLTTPLRETMHDWVAQGRMDNDTCVVLVTRPPVRHRLPAGDPRRTAGLHRHDRQPAARYAVFDLLTVEQGIPAEKFDRVAPIGLAIGARTPPKSPSASWPRSSTYWRRPARSISDARREKGVGRSVGVERTLSCHPVTPVTLSSGSFPSCPLPSHP